MLQRLGLEEDGKLPGAQGVGVAGGWGGEEDRDDGLGVVAGKCVDRAEAVFFAAPANNAGSERARRRSDTVLVFPGSENPTRARRTTEH